MARSSWSGAITFAGFPIAVKAYSLHASAAKDGFKTLCDCHGQPISQVRKCVVDGVEIDVTKQRKGLEIGKGNFRALPPTAVEAIESGGKSLSLDPELVCPVASLDLGLATGAYVLVPDGPAFIKSVETMRQALATTNTAIATRWTMREGSRDAIVVIRGGASELLANTFPFVHQINDAPKLDATNVTVAPGELAMFEQALGALYPNGPFEPKAFESTYNARRAKTIAQAFAGEPITTPAAPAAPSVPDLMAALEASLKNAGTAKTTTEPEAIAA